MTEASLVFLSFLLLLHGSFDGDIFIFDCSVVPFGYFVSFYNQFSVAYVNLVFVVVASCECMAYETGSGGESNAFASITDVEV